VLSAALRNNSTLKVLEIPGNNICAAGASEVVWKISKSANTMFCLSDCEIIKMVRYNHLVVYQPRRVYGKLCRQPC
jgi:hypothetical protein